ncbi:Rv3654c family TadE-like protein [Plantactinospora sp. CA-294935]|uniref:Rv3654c family TadE-like protein n=1 Tax=Plantactinospora sp. CA-294935 TaxID=3240012 RepID=UPI003D920508
MTADRTASATRVRPGLDWTRRGRVRCRRTVQGPDGQLRSTRRSAAGYRPGPNGGGSDRGSATVWLLAVGLVLVVFSLGAAAIGVARVARHQARVAADLGALAGAAYALDGPDRACARAAAIAAANSARITGCTLDGFDLQVTAEVTVEPLPGMTRVARATARAGPVRG